VIDSNVGIKKALLVSKVAITTGSSTLIESILLDTPICVWFGSKSALEENQDMDLINHINLETIGSTIESAMGMNSEDYNTSSILSCDEATDRIVKTVTDSEI
jgi:CDP-glycerol glycerophosphotransferase (TagB/SpsB family)